MTFLMVIFLVVFLVAGHTLSPVNRRRPLVWLGLAIWTATTALLSHFHGLPGYLMAAITIAVLAGTLLAETLLAERPTARFMANIVIGAAFLGCLFNLMAVKFPYFGQEFPVPGLIINNGVAIFLTIAGSVLVITTTYRVDRYMVARNTANTSGAH